MSNHPFLKQAKSSHMDKMRKEGVQGEDQRDKAERLAKGQSVVKKD